MSTIYVLSNPAMPETVFIGYSRKENISSEIAELYTSSVPAPFKCELAANVENARDVLALIHSIFASARISPDRDFFKVSSDQVMAVLKLAGGKDVTPADDGTVTTAATEAAPAPANGRRRAANGRRRPRRGQAKSTSGRKRRRRRPNLNFKQLSIEPGSVLVGRDGTEVIVHDERQVSYQDEVMFITPATRRMLGLDENAVVSAGQYWTYNGRKVSELYDEFHSPAKPDAE
ncbi:MAG: GIY-YIG nuclease family protein [Caldilineaceae bacterium SB0662_bin_9]|uniref:GIY-YIG nuclease family protein n=1 Tax=Caldilineaceae bacterium SB0662_bin_9 TaxID=2605258 RepID=A0A6B1DW01_9CHLR|nr:GIY-YIG nuclease family protein [Caldilineaceae bacterium]MYD91177.1 GIY-YIG nuclease family protein [Caldilineaceae bacterium SB0662_bin_9]